MLEDDQRWFCLIDFGLFYFYSVVFNRNFYISSVLLIIFNDK